MNSGDSDSARGSGRDDEALDELVMLGLSHLERGDEQALDALCAERPEQAATLRRRLGKLRAAGLVGIGGGDDAFPERLGDFRLLQRVGGGGMGVVYLAEQISLDRRVALKLIRPERLYFPGARSRFVREARAVARLAHPGVVQVHAVGEENGTPFIAMEFVEGATLSSVLDDLRARSSARTSGVELFDAVCRLSDVDAGSFDRAAPPFGLGWSDACAWIGRELAQALEHAHQRGVVHRDLKPSNVMLTAGGRVLLVDFGLASASGVDPLTRTGSAIGSLPYMAPEQIEGRLDEVGAQTDIYALGVTLFELASLRRPFEAPDETRLRASILSSQAPRLSALSPHASRDLESVVSVAMAPERRLRYVSAADLARDLSHVLAREPIEARPAGSFARARRWAQRHPAQALAGILAAVIVVGGPLAYGVVQSRAAEKERELGREIAAARELAEQRNEQLSASNAELESRRAELAVALQRESRARELAQSNLDDAMDAVDTLLTRFADSQLQFAPQMGNLRRGLLEQALAFYERFVERRGDDPQVRRRAAVTLRKVSTLREDLGETEAAANAAQRAVDELRALEKTEPFSAELSLELCLALAQYEFTLLALQRNELAESLQRETIERLTALSQIEAHRELALSQLPITRLHLAELLRDTGREPEAIDVFRLAVAELRENIAAQPEDNDAQHRLGLGLTSLANLACIDAKAADGERMHLEAIDAMRIAASRQPDHPPVREALATALGSFGLFLSPRELDERFVPTTDLDAEAALREAIEINDGLIQQFPSRTVLRRNIGGECANLGIHLARLGDFNAARPLVGRAVEEYEALVELEPLVADNHSHLGAALSNAGMLDFYAGRHESASEQLERGRIEHQRAIELEPLNAAFSKHMRQWRVGRVDVWVALKRWREALATIEEFEALNFDAPTRLWAIHRRGQCLGLVRDDESLDETQRARAQFDQLDAIFARLRELEASGNLPDTLLRSIELADLRRRPDFVERFQREFGVSAER